MCKIEDSKRRTEALIAEASQATHTHGITSSLSDAVQRARLALGTVRGTTPHTQPPVPNIGITSGDFHPRNIGLSIKVPEGVLPGTLSGVAGADPMSEEVKKAASPLEGKWLAGESVTEQVRRQKEQFWFSLVEQGFVRPPEALPLSGEEILCAINQLGSGKEPHKNTSEESTEKKINRTLKKTDVPMGHSPKRTAEKTQSHQQTQTKSNVELGRCSNESGSTSEPCCHSVSANSNSSFDNQNKLDVSSGETKLSHSTESQLQQNMYVGSTASGKPSSTETESQSFPSYEGVNSPASGN